MENLNRYFRIWLIAMAVTFAVLSATGQNTVGPFTFYPTNKGGTMQGQAQIGGVAAVSGDIIAAFDPSGECVGAALLTINAGTAYINFVIYGDDGGGHGMTSGEAFTLKLYDTSATTTLTYPTALTGWANTNFSPMPGYNMVTTVYNFGSNMLAVTPATRDVTSAAGTTTFTVASNTSWTVTESVSWFTVSPMSGSNDGYITVTYDENNSTASRTGQITLTAGGGAPAVNVTLTQCGIEPYVYAGDDATICQTGTAQLEGIAQNQNSVLWTTTGTGTFSSTSSLTAVYTPGDTDITTGTVTLTLTASTIAPCAGSASDNMVLTIQKSPTANAGADATICEKLCGPPWQAFYTLSGSVENSPCGGSYWTTAGNGTFNNNLLLNAEYTLGSADVTAGYVDLTLHATACNPCVLENTDVMRINVQYWPIADAGNDLSVCEGVDVEVNGTKQYSDNVFWDFSFMGEGDGTFNSQTQDNIIYTPGPMDILLGYVQLMMVAFPISPCCNPDFDMMTIYITPQPTVNAGDDATICQTETTQLTGTAQNQSSVLWTTSGTGTFSNVSILNPIYSPSTSDINSGSVILTLTANGISSCVVSVFDTIVLQIQKLPYANAGQGGLTCENVGFQLNGSIQNAASIYWQSTGDGIFSNTQILNPVYTPGPMDVLNGTAELSLMANPVSPCLNSVSDFISVDIQALPGVSAGNDASICHSEVFPLNGTVSGSGDFTWSTSGDGTFNNLNSLTAVYTPGVNDILDGNAILTLSALSSLPCTIAATDNLTLTINTCQNLNMPSGWSGLSTYVEPVMQDVQDMFSTVLDDLIILYSQTGIFWPGQNVNTIGQWNMDDGYIIKVANELQLTIPGTRSANRAFQLSQGWNLIPVHSECDAEVVALFAATGLEMVKEVAGWNLYWPALNINTLGNLKPGKSYYVLMTQAATITFPACTSVGFYPGNDAGNLKMTDMINTSSWNAFNSTAKSHILGIPHSTIAPNLIKPGDYIGVFDEQGNCYGMMIWEGQNTSIVTFGDDPTTSQKDGFVDGETLYFKLYVSTTKMQYDLEAVYDPQWPQSDGTFATNGISAIAGFIMNITQVTEPGSFEVMIYPNPANDVLFIDFKDLNETKVIMVDVSGREVLTQTLTELRNQLDISALRNGIYFLKLENEGLIKIEKIVIR